TPPPDGAGRPEWLARAQQELDNLRAALAAATAPGRPAATALRLATGMAPFWSDAGAWSEGRRWLEAALTLPDPCAARPGGAASARRARALRECGVLAARLSDWPAAQARLSESADRYRALGDHNGLAGALQYLGEITQFGGGDEAAAHRLLSESLRLYRTAGNRAALDDALVSLGWLAIRRGDFAEAQELLDEGLVTARAPAH